MRQRASVTSVAGPEQVTFLALPAQALPELEGWRDDFSARSARSSRRSLRRRRSPLFASRATLPSCRSRRPPRAGTGASRRPSRRRAALRVRRPRLDATRRGAHADPFRPRRAAGISGLAVRRAATVEGHGSLVRVDGTVTIGPLRADGTPILSGYGDWLGTENVDADRQRERARCASSSAIRTLPGSSGRDSPPTASSYRFSPRRASRLGLAGRHAPDPIHTPARLRRGRRGGFPTRKAMPSSQMRRWRAPRSRLRPARPSRTRSDRRRRRPAGATTR